MSRPKHRIRAAGAYFVTAETWQRRQIFIKESAARIFIETLLDYRQKGAFLLHDFVLMPDHFHAILTPGRGTTLEKALQFIKGASSFRTGKELRMRFPVWQPGFHEHWVRDFEDYKRCRDYLHLNPVKACLSEGLEDYPFSSASGKYSLDPVSFASGAEAPAIETAVTAGLKPCPAKAQPESNLKPLRLGSETSSKDHD